MFIVLGGTGHVGSSVAATLLEAGKEVTIIAHNSEKTDGWERRGAKAAIVDVLDTDKLRDVFKTGKRLFLLNPPADPSTDTVAEEKRTLSSILKAIKDSGIEKVVAESTGGAQAGDGIGDLGVLYEMEQELKKMKMPSSIIRAGYYMSNWDESLKTAKNEGIVHTFYPVEHKLPMVAPRDIGRVAAKMLTETVEKTGIHYVEGPRNYSPAEVADAFGKSLNKSVKAVETPPEKWVETFKQIGFSDAAARSYAAMTGITLKNPDRAESPIRGETTLDQYIEQLVSGADNQS